MSTDEANRERTVRPIENRLRGLNITAEQADRLRAAVEASAATARVRTYEAIGEAIGVTAGGAWHLAHDYPTGQDHA